MSVGANAEEVEEEEEVVEGVMVGKTWGDSCCGMFGR